jgi:hypothetical protein
MVNPTKPKHIQPLPCPKNRREALNQQLENMLHMWSMDRPLVGLLFVVPFSFLQSEPHEVHESESRAFPRESPANLGVASH